jgi:hypothetical protein
MRALSFRFLLSGPPACVGPTVLAILLLRSVT